MAEKDGFYVVDENSLHQKSKGGVVVDETQTHRRIKKLYVVDENGNHQQFFDWQRIKSWIESFHLTETRSVKAVRFFTKTESFTLQGIWDRTAEDRNNSKSWLDSISLSETREVFQGVKFSKTETFTLQESWPQPNTEDRITIPNAPSSLTATYTNCPSAEVDLSWSDNSSDEDEFEIEHREEVSGSFGPWSQIATVSANTTSYTHTAPAAGTVNEYRVRACNAAGCSSYSNTDSVTTPGTPSTPTSFSVTYIEDEALQACRNELTWNDADDECEYEVYRDGGSGFTQIATRSAGSTIYSDVNISDNTTYDYFVRAVNDFGGTDSSTDSATTGECPFGPE